MEGVVGSREPLISARTLTARVLVWPACAVAIWVHLSFAHRDYSDQTRLQAGLLCSLALLALAFSPVGAFPTLAIGIGYFYVALGAPIFSRTELWLVKGRLRLSSHAFDEATLGALVLASVAILVALIADRATSGLFKRAIERFDRKTVRGAGLGSRARTAGLAFVAIALVPALWAKWLGPLTQPISLLSNSIFALVFLFEYEEQIKTRAARYLPWGAALFLFFLGARSGMLQNAFIPVITAAALAWSRRGKLPLRLLAAGVALLLILNPAKGVYRQLQWYQRGNASSSPWENWSRALEQTYAGKDAETSLNAGVESTRSRTSTLGQVAQIYSWVPSRVPFDGPDRWLYQAVLLVPRVLWPDKPVQGETNRNYTHTFRLQDPRVKTHTSITVPAVGDGYWRLGWLGVGIEGVALGLVLGIAQGISRARTRTAWLLAGSWMIVRTDYHIFGMVTGLVQAFVVAIAVAWLANRLSPPKKAPSRQAEAKPA